jgi:hypothetical protein
MNFTKKTAIALLTLVCLSACSRFGDFKSDKDLGMINHQNIHELKYAADNDSNYNLTVYYPLAENTKTTKTNDPRVSKKMVDVYGNAEIDLYTINGGSFASDQSFYMVSDIGSINNTNQLSDIFDKHHNKSEVGVLGTYVFGKYTLEIHDMHGSLDDSPLYIAVVHERKPGDYSKNMTQDNVVANYNNTTIHQVTFNKLNAQEFTPVLYFASNDKGLFMPLSSMTIYPNGKYSAGMRSIMILVDENGYLITNNRLSENIK